MDEKDDVTEKTASKNKGEVGYKKPPKQTQFRPGQSGNPGGRKRGMKNIRTLLEEGLNQQIQLNRNGDQTQASYIDAYLLQILNHTGKGNVKYAVALLELLKLHAQLQERYDKEQDTVYQVIGSDDEDEEVVVELDE